MKKEKKVMSVEALASVVSKGFEDLAMMTANGFDEVNKRLDKVEKNVEHLDHKVDGLELKISAYASSWSNDFDRLHDWVEELDNRMNKMEDKVAQK